jgi:hypothetical protein
MIISQDLNVLEERYPFSEKLNNDIINYLASQNQNFYELSYKTNVKAKMSSWTLRSECFTPLCKWIASIFRSKIIYAPSEIRFDELWVSKYDHGDFTEPHAHFPALYSFVYFLNSPKGSSPLVFTQNRKKIKPEEGKVVIFPANVVHHVPKNKCQNRIVIAGNISIPSAHPILTL